MTRIALIFIIISLAKIASAKTKDNTQKIGDIEEYERYDQGIKLRIDFGAFIPTDNLKNTLGISPHLGFYFGIPISKKYRVDLGASIFIPINSNSLDYILPDTTLKGKPILSGTMGLWVTRTQSVNNTFFWDNRIGTGLGFFQTDIATNKPKEENDNVYSSETMFLNLGTEIRKIIFTKRSIGLAVNYLLSCGGCIPPKRRHYPVSKASCSADTFGKILEV